MPRRDIGVLRLVSPSIAVSANDRTDNTYLAAWASFDSSIRLVTGDYHNTTALASLKLAVNVTDDIWSAFEFVRNTYSSRLVTPGASDEGVEASRVPVGRHAAKIRSVE